MSEDYAELEKLPEGFGEGEFTIDGDFKGELLEITFYNEARSSEAIFWDFADKKTRAIILIKRQPFF